VIIFTTMYATSAMLATITQIENSSTLSSFLNRSFSDMAAYCGHVQRRLCVKSKFLPDGRKNLEVLLAFQKSDSADRHPFAIVDRLVFAARPFDVVPQKF
jgi:hypothetical protein